MSQRGKQFEPDMAAVSGMADRRALELEVFRKFAVEMIPIRDESELFWYVVRNVVGRLGFVDCVIYRLDETAGELVQVAALGEKSPSPDAAKILNRLTLALNVGITGHVATSKQPVIVGDLRLDPRYISDLVEARSEICVPLLDGDRVLGVIDCEHPLPHWFGQHELDTLTSVAALTTAQLKQCRMNDELDAARAELAAALDISQKAAQTQTRFMSGASHELRTPLNAIVGFSRILSSGGQIARDPEVAREYAENIHEAGENLTRIINNILDLAAIEGGNLKLCPERLDLPMEVQQALPMLAESSHVCLACDLDDPNLWAWCDIRHFRRMLINLLDNAIKYSGDAPKIEIRIERVDNTVHLSVGDQGKGIEPERLDTLFEPFQRSDQIELAQVKGAGLGLTLSRELARANGGDIIATSHPGQGSVFTIILNCDASSEVSA
jgi:signal transduction histidine kinase